MGEASKLMEWFNRAGIVLNFIAGFLLAPELIGLERLKELEMYLEDRLTKALEETRRRHGIFDRLRQSSQMKLNLLLLKVTGIVAGLCVISVVIAATLVRIHGFTLPLIAFFAYVYLWLLVMSYSFYIEPLEGSFLTKILRYNVLLLTYYPGRLLTTFLAYALLVLLLFTVYRTALTIATRLIRSAVHTLEGERRIQGILVTLGIFAFVIGNLLQLVATFNGQ